MSEIEIVVKIPTEAMQKEIARIVWEEVKDYRVRNWIVQQIQEQVKGLVREYFVANMEAEVVRLLREKGDDIRREIPKIAEEAVRKVLASYASHVASPMVRPLTPVVKARLKKLVEEAKEGEREP
jgi:histone H3/H4